MNVVRNILLTLSPILYGCTALILLSGIPQIFSKSDFSFSPISLVLTLFIVAIHLFVIWNIIKRKHITLVLAPCFEAYFLFNLYLFLRPFSAEKILVFDSVTYPELMLVAGISVLLLCVVRLVPLIIYRYLFVN